MNSKLAREMTPKHKGEGHSCVWMRPNLWRQVAQKLKFMYHSLCISCMFFKFQKANKSRFTYKQWSTKSSRDLMYAFSAASRSRRSTRLLSFSRIGGFKLQIVYKYLMNTKDIENFFIKIIIWNHWTWSSLWKSVLTLDIEYKHNHVFEVPHLLHVGANGGASWADLERTKRILQGYLLVHRR